MQFNKKAIISYFKNPRSAWQTAFLVALAASVYFLRASQYLLQPQLYGDDGPNWLAAGYNQGFRAVFHTVGGFLHVPERLFGIFVAHLTLQHAPLVFALSAWAIFILFVYYLFSSRTKILTTNYERLFMLLTLSIAANLDEFFFNFSNSMFLLGVVGALIIAANKPRQKLLEVAEKILFLLMCFSLPLAWFYLPISLFERYKYKQKSWFFITASAIGSLSQLAAYMGSHASRSSITIRSLLTKDAALEVYNQIITPIVRFARVDLPTFGSSGAHDGYTLCVLGLSMATLAFATFIVFKNSNKQVRYLLFFLAAMTAASLKSPQLQGEPLRVIQFLSVADGGDRYFVYGLLAVNLVLIKTSLQTLVPRARYLFMVAFVSFGLLSALHFKTFYIEKNFVDYRLQYHAGIYLLQSGQAKSVRIPINPHDAAGWHITLGPQ